MKCVLITGMSGTGKSTLIGELRARGFNAIDFDSPEWSEWVDYVSTNESDSPVKPGRDWVWREDRVRTVLSQEDGKTLFVSGCAINMSKFYPYFTHIVLLSAPAAVVLERLKCRTTNAYGKSSEEAARVLSLIQTVEPLLRKKASHEIDTSAPLKQVVETLLRLCNVGDSIKP
jgi:dephospho-CoA kinase